MAETFDETPGLTYWYTSGTEVLDAKEIQEGKEATLAAALTSAVAHAHDVATRMGVAEPSIRVTIHTEWTEPFAPEPETEDGD